MRFIVRKTTVLGVPAAAHRATVVTAVGVLTKTLSQPLGPQQQKSVTNFFIGLQQVRDMFFH